MKELAITWQRLVDGAGATCPRCAGTQQEMAHAVDRLRAGQIAASRLLDPSISSST